MFAKTAIVALFAGLVAAQATPKGDPMGNPITRPLNEVVPACQPFTITWTPTTANSVSLLLLKGPSNNVVPFGAPIVVGIPNSGSFTWTPASSVPATEGPAGYGIQLIDDVTGQYQYSTQFGVSHGAACDTYSAPASSSSQYGGGYPMSTPSKAHSSAEGYPTASGKPTSKVEHSMTPSASVYYPTGTGAPHGNSTVIQPTKPITLPSSLQMSPTASASSPPVQTTNAAAGLKAGMGLVGAAAAFAWLL